MVLTVIEFTFNHYPEFNLLKSTGGINELYIKTVPRPKHILRDLLNKISLHTFIEIPRTHHVSSMKLLFLRHIKGSPYPSHFLFKINVGESRTRRRTTLNFEWRHHQSILKDHSIQIRCSCMSDPRLSDINFNNKMAWVWTTFKWDSRSSSIGKNGVQNANCPWAVNSWSRRSSEEVEKF